MHSSIGKIQTSDFESVLKIADVQLGASYITRKDLVRFSELDQILLFKRDNEIAGFITWEQEIPQSILLFISQNNRDKLFIKSIVTDPNFQKQGIATKMVSQLIHNYPDYHIVLLGWKVMGRCNIEKLCMSLGFKNVGEIKDIWKSDCEAGEFKCPDYDAECRCTALVFEK